MSKVAIVYWSGTGNTEAMADLVAQGVSAKGGEPTIIQASDFDASRLKEFDAIAFGCPAMGTKILRIVNLLLCMMKSNHCLAIKKLLCLGHTTGMMANGWSCGNSALKMLE